MVPDTRVGNLPCSLGENPTLGFSFMDTRVLVLFLAACGGSPVKTPPNPTPTPTGSTTHASMPDAVALDVAWLDNVRAKGCRDTCCAGHRDEAAVDAVPTPALLDVLEHGEPTARAIVAMSLARRGAPEALDPLVGKLDATEGAWVMHVAISQMVQPCYPIEIVTVPFGRVALESLSKLVGRQFTSADDVRTWRKAHASVWQEPAYFDAHPDRLASLRASDPAGFVRIAIALEPSVASRPSDAELLAAAKRDVGAEKLFAILAPPGEHPSVEDDRAFMWICRHAADFFTAKDAARLATIQHDAEGRGAAFMVRASFAAVAVAAVSPDARTVLEQSYDRETSSAVAAELAARFWDVEIKRLGAAFADTKTSFIIREAILEGLSRRKTAKADLAALIKSSKSRDPFLDVLGALVDAVGKADPAFPAEKLKRDLIPPLKKMSTDASRARDAEELAAKRLTVYGTVLEALGLRK